MSKLTNEEKHELSFELCKIITGEIKKWVEKNDSENNCVL